MPSCVYRGCRNYSLTIKDKNISFHRLPKDGPIRDKWLNVIRIQRKEFNWQPTRTSTVCTEHFLASDVFLTRMKQRRIKNTAVPVIMVKYFLYPVKFISKSKINLTEIKKRVNKCEAENKLMHDFVATSSPSGDLYQSPDLLSQIPTGIVLISRVYHYLQHEYEQLKSLTNCDLSEFSDTLERTARATGLPTTTVTRVLELEKRKHDDDDVGSKRSKISHDDYDCDSPIKEEPEEEEAHDSEQSETEYTDDAQTHVTAQHTDQQDLQIELKIEPDDGQTEQLHGRDSDPLNELTDQTQSALPGICSTSSIVEIKIEPPDVDYTPSSISARACSDATSDVIKTEPDDNHFTI